MGLKRAAMPEWDLFLDVILQRNNWGFLQKSSRHMKYHFQAFQSTGKDISQRRNFKPVPYAESIKYFIQEKLKCWWSTIVQLFCCWIHHQKVTYPGGLFMTVYFELAWTTPLIKRAWIKTLFKRKHLVWKWETGGNSLIVNCQFSCGVKVDFHRRNVFHNCT